MAEILSGEQLAALRTGDRLTYFGVRWQVKNYSTYTDAKGYEIEEWWLKSTTGKAYYLLREVDPSSSSADVHWYIAEELSNPKLYDPGTQTDVLTTVADRMRGQETPYPVLQLFNRHYQFESKTEGTYESDDCSQERITWDYWDAAHVWNLALETWRNGKLSIYSTREVQPEDFSEFRENLGNVGQSMLVDGAMTEQVKHHYDGISRQNQLLFAWGLVVFGFFLMVMGV